MPKGGIHACSPSSADLVGPLLNSFSGQKLQNKWQFIMGVKFYNHVLATPF